MLFDDTCSSAALLDESDEEARGVAAFLCSSSNSCCRCAGRRGGAGLSPSNEGTLFACWIVEWMDRMVDDDGSLAGKPVEHEGQRREMTVRNMMSGVCCGIIVSKKV